jgi:3-oxoacyl-[acyl-carrier protein] reductase
LTVPGHRVALVTGAARGIGRSIVDALAKDGFHIVALDRDFDGSDLAESEALALIRYDLTDIAGVAALVDSLGRIDVLINNAGVQNGLAIDAYTDAARERILTVNLKAPVELIRNVSRQMVERRRAHATGSAGRIVNLTSVAAFMAHSDLWYGVTKAGIVSLTRSVAALLGPQGIQVNAVAPGPIDTDMLNKFAQPERRAQLMQAVWSRRAGTPDELAEVVRWLAADAPVILNGAVIDVTDGCFLR